MGTYTLDQTTIGGNRGSHYNPGSEFLFYVNENGTIWRQPVNPATTIAQISGKTIAANSSHNLNNTGAADIKWTGSQLQALPTSSGKIQLLSTPTSLNQVLPADLMAINWTQAPNQVSENGQNSAGGVYYAVRMPFGADNHYTKFRIYKDGNVTKADWITYLTSTKPLLLHSLIGYQSPRDIVVSAYESTMYVSGGASGDGYVLSIPRIAAGSFPQYSSNPTQMNTEPLQNPQQIAVEDDNVFVVDEGGLFFIDSERGNVVQVVSGISAPVGLLLDKQDAFTYAYITNNAGDVYVVDISEFSPPVYDLEGNVVGTSQAVIEALAPVTELKIGDSSGYLTWADNAHTAFYAPVPGSNQIKRVDIVAKMVTIEPTDQPIGSSPQSVVVFDEFGLSVICGAEIGDITRGMAVTGVLLMGIGLIPFDYIIDSANTSSTDVNRGKADTSTAPGYYFSAYPKLAFASSLSILINHTAAWNGGARYYKATWTNEANETRTITNSFVDLKWNPQGLVPRFQDVTTNPVNTYYFSVRDPADLWYNPFLGFIVHTGLADNGYNRLKVEFFNANFQPLPGASFERLIFVDNTEPHGKLFDLRRGNAQTPPADDEYQSPTACGVLVYESKDDLVEFDIIASRPDGLGEYKLTCYRGGSVSFTTSGNVTPTEELITVSEFSANVPFRIGRLTGNCNVANITIILSVPARAINGYGWVDLGARTGKTFTLAIAPLVDTPWTPH